MHDYYMYIFVRQDISPEQQLIQFAHACYVAGCKFQSSNPERIAFVGIGVPNVEGLEKAMMLMEDAFIPYVEFKEPDIGNEVTAVACRPLMGALRQVFKKYNTLRFD